MSEVSRPQRVAIVGGGCAGLTAAFELSRPEHQGRYEVTVYQQGWRLGGKGASGRGASQRIEEHGLHLWLGFYENAFALMRECYAQRRVLHPEQRFADWRDAFKPAPDVAVADRVGNDWQFWRAHFAPGRGEPGDPLSQGGPFTVTAYLQQSALLVTELIRSARAREPAQPAGSAPGGTSPQGLDAALDTLLRYGKLATAAAVAEAAELLLQAVNTWVPQLLREGSAALLRLIDAVAQYARQQIARIVEGDDELRRLWQVADLILAILRGATVHGLAFDPRGFDAINDHDWRDWLRGNGASEPSLQSGFLRGIYDLAFAFEDGDVARPRLAAGVALRGAMRMFFTYRGSLFYSMSAGMGDIVFAPLYQVLRARGVKFAFFHRLRRIEAAPPQPGVTPHVRALHFDLQAELAGATYEPLVDVKGVACWPAQPDWSQLAHGAELQAAGCAFEAHADDTRAAVHTIEVMRDFDFVVLGVGVAVLPHVAAELIAREPRWADMVRHVKTVPTQAFQLWLREDMHALGWPHAAVNLSGFVEPFDTWADMRHLIPEESFAEPVRAIAYFCSVLPDAAAGDAAALADAEFQRRQRAQVRDNAVAFIDRDLAALWPRAAAPAGGFRWDLLVPAAPESAAQPGDASRFDTQYWTANINPSDRYVLSLPGSPAYRVSPLDRSFDNLTIAGDWTATGLDTGCIESAVISGRLAAHAISRLPALEDIVGYDHP